MVSISASVLKSLNANFQLPSPFSSKVIDNCHFQNSSEPLKELFKFDKRFHREKLVFYRLTYYVGIGKFKNHLNTQHYAILYSGLGTYFVFRVGYIFCIQGWVHILYSGLGTYFVFRVGYIFCIQGWVHILYSGLGTYFVFRVGYIFSSLILTGITR